jgi:hypothetical protein
MIFLILLILSWIFIQFGLLPFIQIFIWFMVFLISNFLIGINPFLKKIHVIRVISIIIIIFIIYYNSVHSQFLTALIFPFSIDKISFFHKVKPSYFNISSEWKMYWLFEFNIEEMSNFLDTLDINENYLVNIEFIPDISEWDSDAPMMILSKTFLINRNSSATTITKFINERLEYMVDYYYFVFLLYILIY